MPDASTLVFAVAGPMTKVLCVCLTGYICALPRVGLLGQSTRSSVSRLNVNLFLPPFLFTTLSKSINLSALMVWWPIPLFVVFNIILGVFLGFCLVHVLGHERTKEHRGLILAACACGNVRKKTFPFRIVSFPNAVSSRAYRLGR
jgi:predicted permease